MPDTLYEIDDNGQIRFREETECSQTSRTLNQVSRFLFARMDSYDNVPPSEPNSGGCYIATAVYGSYDCPEVWILRRFRDYSIAKSVCGRLFIKLYYTVSPVLVKLFGNTMWFQRFWKEKLDKIVQELKERGYQDTPYCDGL